MKAYEIPNFETIVNGKIFADDYIKYLVKEGRISEKLALSIKSNLQIGPKNNKILDKELLLKIYNYLGNYEYNHLLKNVLAHNEYCPICFNDLDYVDGFCKKCGFNFDWADLCSDDFKTMRKLADFVDSHEELIEERDHWLEIDSDDGDNLSFELYTIIYFDEDLKKEFESLHLNEWVDLDDLFGYDDDTYEVNDNVIYLSELDVCTNHQRHQYRLNPKNIDSYIIQDNLNRFNLYSNIKKGNDVELALENLSYVPYNLSLELFNSSFKEGYLTHNACKANWHDFSKDLSIRELKMFLEKHNLDSSGDREELISRIFESNIQLEEFNSEKTFLTQKAYDYLSEHEWIQFYDDHLYNYDFLEFTEYFKNHEGSVDEIALSYLNEHIKLTYDSSDFDYIAGTYLSKTIICHLVGNFKEALTCDMRLFLLNMNPIYFNMVLSCRFSVPFFPIYITHLKELKLRFGEEIILESFNENWNFMDFEKIIVPKDDARNILITALNSKDNDWCKEVYDKYFKQIFGIRMFSDLNNSG